MATFLINASNLKNGGGLQVAQSICGELKRFNGLRFIVVLSTFINDEQIDYGDNIEVYKYNLPQNFRRVMLGRDAFLDDLVAEKDVDAVLTVFGPSLWRPRVPHLCGFARAQLLLKVKGYKLKVKERILHKMWAWGFRRSSKVFYTENEYISNMLPSLIKGAKVYTVTNYYNQVFDQPEKWRRSITLPKFEGVTCLTITANYPHKNLGIISEIVREIKKMHPELPIRFVLTIGERDLPFDDDVRDNILRIGKVDISECPHLYEQSDIMFMPTLLECFTATYPEAMRMEVPIVTTDLEFAHGLCGDAACYYSAVDAKAAAEAIYHVVTDEAFRKQLVENGKKQLLIFDDYEQRAEKLIGILEGMASKE